MSLHEDIQQKMRAAIVEASEQDMNDLPPSWIANQVYDAYGNTSVDAHVPYRRTEHAHPQRYCRRRRKPDWQSMTVASHSYPVRSLPQWPPSFFAGCLRVNSSDNLAELLIKISEHRHKAAHVLLHFGRHRLK